MGQLEARKGETFVLLDTLYSEITDDPGLPNPGASLGITARMALAELDTGVHLVEQEGLQVDALVGLRYWYWYTKLDPKGFSGTVSTQFGSEQWVDGIVGMRAILDLQEQWLLNLRADYGGFGIGSGSDSTYQLAAVTEYATEGSLRFGLA